MKTFFKAIGLLAVAVLVFVLVKGEELKDYEKLKEAGYQVVEPVNMWLDESQQNENGTYYPSAYRISFRVNTEDGDMYLTLPLMKAYDTDSLLKAQKDYKKGKCIEGYFYYTVESGNVYYSDTISSKEEYIRQDSQPAFLMLGFVIVFLLVPFMLCWGFERLPASDITQQYMQEKDSVVCTYRTYIYGILVLICLGMGIMMFALVFHLISGTEYIIACVFFLLALLFIVLGVIFILFMKNWILVFHSGGIIYRNLLGNVYQCRDEDVIGCTVIYAPKRHSIHIHTKQKDIWLNVYCTNYKLAKAVIRKYR